jgi:hypothetical protein
VPAKRHKTKSVDGGFPLARSKRSHLQAARALDSVGRKTDERSLEKECLRLTRVDSFLTVCLAVAYRR